MTPTRRLAFALSAAVLAGTFAPALLAQSPAGQTGPYKILKVEKLGGDGGWDYLAADAATRQLYIARSGATGSLHVYNLDTLAPIGDVPTGNAHGAAIDNATHHGFATSNPVTMFDTKTLKVIKTINTGGHPDGYLADPALHRVYILSHAEPNVTILDAKTGDILKQINLGGEPEESELDNHGHLFIDVENMNRIAVVDTATMALTGNYDISSVSGGCAGLAIDKAHDVLFAACRDKNNMVILSATDGKIITTLPIGVGCDGAHFNPATQEVYSTQGDGTLTIIKDLVTNRSEATPTDFAVEQTVKTEPGARTITFDPKTGHIFTATADFGPAPALKPGQRYARRPMLPDSFRLLVIGK
ncbi:MAG: YncE family protein [Acidobacteriaceae bacterium]